MLFMVIETFPDQDPIPIYRHLRDRGRGLPEGLTYVDSWIEADFGRCFQIMECENARLFQEWALHWRGRGVRLEITPIVPSGEVQALIEPHLDD